MTRAPLMLRPYQQQARQRIWELLDVNEGALCAMDLGTGKTPTTLQVIKDSLFDRFDTTRWLVVGPKLVVEDSWPSQLDKWDAFAGLTYDHISAETLGLTPGVLVNRNLKDQVVHPNKVQAADTVRVKLRTGNRAGQYEFIVWRDYDMELHEPAWRAELVLVDAKATRQRLLRGRAHIDLVQWGLLYQVVQAMGGDWCYDGVVIDESEFVGDSSGQWHKAVYHVVHRLQAVKHIVLLSGLPTPSGRENVHGQARLVDGGKTFGKTKTEFHETWCTPVKKNWQTGQVYKWGLRPDKEQEFEEALDSLAFSLKVDLGLPEWSVNDVLVDLDGPTQAAVDALVARSVFGEGDPATTIAAPSAAVLIEKVRQLTTGAALTLDGTVLRFGQAKYDRALELVETLKRQDRPVVIAYLWDHEFEMLRKLIPGLLNISDKGVLRAAKEGALKVVAGQAQAFSHGVDGLQHVFRDVIWTAATYNYGTWEQLRKRFHRDGVKGEVMVHRLLAKDTIEEHIVNVVLPGKMSDSDALLSCIDLLARRGKPGLHSAPIETGEQDG